jgi:hypothetical protein
VLHHLSPEDDPNRVLGRILDTAVPGSYLAISHTTADFAPGAMTSLAAHLNAVAGEPFVLRNLEAVSGFFAGLELVVPGVVQVDRWRAGDACPVPAEGGWVPALYGGVARVP